jgi:hypothetical protein
VPLRSLPPQFRRSAFQVGDPASRIAIAARLLDDGADASAATDSHVNALHVLPSATASVSAPTDSVNRNEHSASH